MHFPLALTQISFWALLIGFVSSLAWIGFGVFAPGQTKVVRKASRLSLAMIGILAFLAVWAWMSVCLPVLAWMLWIGDNNHWFYDYSTRIAAFIALMFSLVVTYRAMSPRATALYLQVQICCSLILLLLFGTIWGWEWARRIEAMTPEKAAQKILQRHFPLGESEGLYLVESHRAADASRTLRHVTYVVMGKDEPRGAISVSRYSRFWWVYSSWRGYPPSASELQRAKEWLKNPTNRDNARSALESIVRTYPGTRSAEEARSLLERWNENKRPASP